VYDDVYLYRWFCGYDVVIIGLSGHCNEPIALIPLMSLFNESLLGRDYIYMTLAQLT